MARIRTVKPEFFRHEGLQDLEIKNPGKYPMFVFEGLWLVSDKDGRFEWRPRQIKLDILPFLSFDMEETLLILKTEGYIQQYTINGKDYGFIPSFKTHQRIDGKEKEAPERYPSPLEQIGTRPEHTQNIPDTQERTQEREKEREREKEKEKERKGSQKKQKTSFPENFKISERVKKWAIEKGWADLDEHLESFRLKCRSKDYQYVDWDEAFMNAIRDNWAKVGNANGNGVTKSTIVTHSYFEPVNCPTCGKRILIKSDLTKTGCIYCPEAAHA